MSEEVQIDSSNFSEHFFDARRFGPKKGQIMAKFSSVAFFGAGQAKKDIIRLLQKDKAREAAQVMNKIHCAKEPDCYRVCREICEDMLSGMSPLDVEKKDYKFVLEAVYYTKRENVPENDPHWTTLNVLEYDEETNTFRSKIAL